jgi:hypothetical protein
MVLEGGRRGPGFLTAHLYRVLPSCAAPGRFLRQAPSMRRPQCAQNSRPRSAYGRFHSFGFHVGGMCEARASTHVVEQVVQHQRLVQPQPRPDRVGHRGPSHLHAVASSHVIGVDQLLDLLLLGPDSAARVDLVPHSGPNC